MRHLFQSLLLFLICVTLFACQNDLQELDAMAETATVPAEQSGTPPAPATQTSTDEQKSPAITPAPAPAPIAHDERSHVWILQDTSQYKSTFFPFLSAGIEPFRMLDGITARLADRPTQAPDPHADER